ncbi:MAG: SdpI family protein [Gemmatimonadota bacterium]
MNVLLLVGLVLVVLSVPLALSRIPPNPVYGLRTSAACSSRAVWFAANRFVGRLGVAGGALLAIAGFNSGRSSPLGVLLARDDVQMALTLGVVGVLTVAGVRRARALATKERMLRP